jgi:pyrroloquinoline quinone (PQQ) biosynthesis protein C
MGSANFIFSGSSRNFIDDLCKEALEHRAVKHHYFERLSKLKGSKADDALREFVYQYSFYTRNFDLYNEAVLATVHSESHKRVILENIADEHGSGESGFKGLPHRTMYSLFCSAIGVDEIYRSNTPPSITAKLWGDLFLQKCASSEPGVALAAISIGTEHVVPPIYSNILRLIKNSSFHDIEETYFFALHAQCDVHHSRALIEVLYEFCEDFTHREAVRFGVISALNLRAAFFDVMAAKLEVGVYT